MGDNFITLYRKAKMSIMGGLSGAVDGVLDETCYYDVGYMQSQIKRIQKVYSEVSNELEINIDLKEKSDAANNKKYELVKQREQLLVHLIFLASNSFENLDDCVKMAEGYSIPFMDCVQGLIAYKNGNRSEAFDILEKYYKKYKSVENHFLINKVFGLLLKERQQYQKAVSFLTYALQFTPDDIETLEALRICYEKLNDCKKLNIMNDLTSLFA